MIDALAEVLGALSFLSIMWLPIVVLYFLSGKIYRLLGRRKTIAMGIVGVPVHELSHLIVAVLCGHKILSFKLWQPSSDGTLGYVEHAFRRGFFFYLTNILIALAPLAGGFAAFLGLTWLLRPDILVVFGQPYHGFLAAIEVFSGLLVKGPIGISLVWLLIGFSLLAFCCPSKADFQCCKGGLVFLLGLALAFAFFLPGSVLSAAFGVLHYAQLIGSTLMLVVALLCVMLFAIKVKILIGYRLLRKRPLPPSP